MRKATYCIFLLFLLAGAFLAGSWYNQRTVVKTNLTAVRKVLYYRCPMHLQSRSDRPGNAPCCGMRLEAVYADDILAPAVDDGSSHQPYGAVGITLAKQQLMGVRVSAVEQTPGASSLRLFGRVTPDETRTYRLNAGVDGWIGEVSPVTTGSQVDKDQLLATYSTPDLFQSSQAFLFALTGTDRLKQGGPENPQINPINSNFRQRIERLRSLGMSAIQIEELRRTRVIPETIKILAPGRGFVLTRNVSPGQRFDKGSEWYRIADLRRVWILADVFQRDTKYIQPGQRVRVTLPADRTVFSARVSDVLPQFDPNSRTLKVRLEVENRDYILRPDMFVDVELSIALPPAITVPADAVVDSGLNKTVFVERGDGFFEPRQVETGWRFGDRVQIVAGLEPGQRIVTSGNFLMDSESRMQQAGGNPSGEATKDPVCGMDLNAGKARHTSAYSGRRYQFCSGQCKQAFDKEPGRYLNQAAGGKRPGPRSEGQPSKGVAHRGGLVSGLFTSPD